MDQTPPARCPNCGTASPLDQVKVVASSANGGEDNLIWLCPNCHYAMDRGSIRTFEFEKVLAQLMEASGQFEEGSIFQDATVLGLDRRQRVDIKAIELAGHQPILIECKTSMFGPKPAQDMLVACLWDRWTHPREADLNSFAAITDEPTLEVAATGHQRTIITIQERYLSDWLAPAGVASERLETILRDKQVPIYAHQIAA